MGYLYGYLGIGAVFLVVIFTAHQLTKSSSDDDISDLVLACDPNSGKWWWRPLDTVVIPLLAGIVVVAAWPIAIYWKAKEIINSRKLKPEGLLTEVQKRREFGVSPDRLIRCCTLEEIEKRETILDPLNAAPRIPFGHLNHAWLRFREQVVESDLVWYFSTPWTSDWGREELREGYVIVRGSEIGPHFLTKWLPVEKADDAGWQAQISGSA